MVATTSRLVVAPNIDGGVNQVHPRHDYTTVVFDSLMTDNVQWLEAQIGPLDVFLPLLEKNITKTGYPAIKKDLERRLHNLFNNTVVWTAPNSGVESTRPQVHSNVYVLFIVLLQIVCPLLAVCHLLWIFEFHKLSDPGCHGQGQSDQAKYRQPHEERTEAQSDHPHEERHPQEEEDPDEVLEVSQANPAEPAAPNLTLKLTRHLPL